MKAPRHSSFILSLADHSAALPFFGFWCGFRERKESDPKLVMCMNKGNQQRRLAYEKKYK
jgi:hypothetical protein